MSETPRTDEQAGYPDGSGCWKYTELGLYVDADFARQLERENARLLYALKCAEQLLENATSFERENARLLYALKCAEQFLENATSSIGVINDHDIPKALYTLDVVRFALAKKSE